MTTFPPARIEKKIRERKSEEVVRCVVVLCSYRLFISRQGRGIYMHGGWVAVTWRRTYAFTHIHQHTRAVHPSSSARTKYGRAEASARHYVNTDSYSKPFIFTRTTYHVAAWSIFRRALHGLPCRQAPSAHDGEEIKSQTALYRAKKTHSKKQKETPVA